MRAYCPIKNVVHVVFDSQYACCSAFMRVQEYYESQIETIRGSYFTLEEFMDAYAASRKGNFTYFTDWAGFNLPCYVIKSFLGDFKGKLLEKEKALFDLIQKTLKANGHKKGELYYVIGTFDSNGQYEDEDVVTHELAHAMFYLSEEYRDVVTERINKFSDKVFNEMKSSLLKKGYCEDVIVDEIQAYLASNTFSYCGKSYKKHSTWFSQKFELYRDKYSGSPAHKERVPDIGKI